MIILMTSKALDLAKVLLPPWIWRYLSLRRTTSSALLGMNNQGLVLITAAFLLATLGL
jgi:hypothetical protein